MNLSNITVELYKIIQREPTDLPCKIYAIARDNQVLLDTWSDGSQVPSWWECKPYDLQEAIDTQDRELIELLNETPEQKTERVAKREASYDEFMAAIDRDAHPEVIEIG